MNRRTMLQQTIASGGALALTSNFCLAEDEQRPAKTEFLPARMTLPYNQFPLQRALEGIARAGYQHVAWGTTHLENGGERVPVMAADAAPAKAKQLGQRCRNHPQDQGCGPGFGEIDHYRLLEPVAFTG